MSAMSATPALTFHDVTLAYDRHPAVHHLSGEVGAGALMAIVGPNGAGKSTLLKGIVGALPLASGRIVKAKAAGRTAYLPQAADIDRSFPICVYDLVAMGLWSRVGLFGGVSRKNKTRLAEAMEAVGLGGFENRPIGTLSGGQMQRALFARLLLQDADLILLDEPFTAIDAKTAADLLDLVKRWHAEQRTVVAVLHDLDLVKRAFPETLLIAREPIAWGETNAALAPENMLKARRMIEAFDPFADACQRSEAA